MTITVRSAPTHSRKLVKSSPYIRRQIAQASKAEEKAVPGATAERERLTAKFGKDIRDVEAAIGQTRAVASDMDRTNIILRTGKQLPDAGPVSRLANLAIRLGAKIDPDLPATVAERATSAADAAETRMDNADAELRSTALLAQLSAHLPAVDFDIKSPRVAGIRRDYLSATQIAADRRKGQSK
ncbi:hypothetical protein [Shimia sagamensis]|uniref:Uncharacterized protein n=1 Tax=Shimia sagamensis TaxID=1566352 RepID=A0ABY1PIT6_9RHOB|nr:hypothetical protein [Shimia sagamensis]SMP35325.1 hypothetical protein SAMN06265373_11168 [Shimia sagamensis]